MSKNGMTGSEIARHLGITRQAVSQSLKSAMRKIYFTVMSDPETDSPFDAAMSIMSILGQETCGKQDLEEFFQLFPTDIQREIRIDASRLYPRNF